MSTLLFCPFLTWRFNVLESQHIEDSETAKDFAKRVQVRMSRELGYEGTHISSKEVSALLTQR